MSNYMDQCGKCFGYHPPNEDCPTCGPIDATKMSDASTEPPDTAFIEELMRLHGLQCETIQALGKAFIEVLKRTPGSVEHALKTIAESEGRGGPDVDDRVKELEKELATTGDYYNAAVKRANKAEAELAAKSREFESWRSRALKAETDLAVMRDATIYLPDIPKTEHGDRRITVNMYARNIRILTAHRTSK